MKAPLSDRAKQILSNAETSKELMNYLAFKTHRFGTIYKAPTFEVKNAAGINITVEPSIGKVTPVSVAVSE